LNFFVLDDFDGDEGGVLNVINDFRQLVVLALFPEEVKLEVIVVFLHFREADFVLVELTDDRTGVVDRNRFPALLAHLVTVTGIYDLIEVLLDRVQMPHVLGRHHDLVVAVEGEFDLL